MKNTKEILAILTTIFAINQTSKNKDYDIDLILDYAFRRLFERNTIPYRIACIGKTKEEIMTGVYALLKSETKYEEYLKEQTK